MICRAARELKVQYLNVQILKQFLIYSKYYTAFMHHFHISLILASLQPKCTIDSVPQKCYVSLFCSLRGCSFQAKLKGCGIIANSSCIDPCCKLRTLCKLVFGQIVSTVMFRPRELLRVVPHCANGRTQCYSC
jgi:hypothetical protein